jgi:AAA family ATPase
MSQESSQPHLPTQTEGCSGAEIVGLCQEAAMFTMRMDMNALHVSLIIFMMTWFFVNGDDPLQVPQSAFIAAAKTTQRQITKEVILKYTSWGDHSHRDTY